MTMTMMPVADSDRLESLDALRGVAVLGILIMNIQMFSMVFAMYFNPHALGPASTVDRDAEDRKI